MSSTVLAVVLGVTFLAVALAGQGVWWAWSMRKDARNRDLSRRLGAVVARAEEARILRRNMRDRLTERLGSLGAWLDGLNQQAGRPTSVRAILAWVAVAAGIGGGLLVLALQSPLGLAGMAAGVVPVLVLHGKAEARSAKLTEQLPDALDLVGRSLQAGHGLSEALRMCAEELLQPIAGELGRVYEEHNLGRDFRECMENLVRRNPRNFDLRLFAGSVLLQRETGGNLVEIVQNIASTIRARFNLQAKGRALTAEARLSAIILGALPLLVATMIVGLRPFYLAPLLTDPLGKAMLVYAVGSYFAGVVAMKRLARIRS